MVRQGSLSKRKSWMAARRGVLVSKSVSCSLASFSRRCAGYWAKAESAAIWV